MMNYLRLTTEVPTDMEGECVGMMLRAGIHEATRRCVNLRYR